MHRSGTAPPYQGPECLDKGQGWWRILIKKEDSEFTDAWKEGACLFIQCDDIWTWSGRNGCNSWNFRNLTRSAAISKVPCITFEFAAGSKLWLFLEAATHLVCTQLGGVQKGHKSAYVHKGWPLVQLAWLVYVLLTLNLIVIHIDCFEIF